MCNCSCCRLYGPTLVDPSYGPWDTKKLSDTIPLGPTDELLKAIEAFKQLIEEGSEDEQDR